MPLDWVAQGIRTLKYLLLNKGGKKRAIPIIEDMAWLIKLLLLRLMIPSLASPVCSECSAYATKVLNISIELNDIFRESFPVDYRFNLSEMRPGICEATIAFVNRKFYVNKSSRTVSSSREEKKVLYLRHKEFFVSLLDQIRQTEHSIGNLVPDFLFNLETQDNPTCKYPREEMRTSLVPVKGLVHHSFCSPRLCDGIFLLPMSYNQKIEACEATRSLDARGAEIPWSQRKKKLFWRGANKGKKSEYYFFDWKFSDMPRQRAIRLLQKRKDSDVKFGFVPWLELVQHRYILSLAGNTYSSLFKHALRSGSCILRQEERMFEWFEPFLKEWKHYVPIKWDLSDLLNKLDWVKKNDVEAKRISENARQLGIHLFSKRILSCYTYCGIEYFKNLLDERLDMDFIERDFTQIGKVCNSKRGKRKDCFDLK